MYKASLILILLFLLGLNFWHSIMRKKQMNVSQAIPPGETGIVWLINNWADFYGFSEIKRLVNNTSFWKRWHLLSLDDKPMGEGEGRGRRESLQTFPMPA